MQKTDVLNLSLIRNKTILLGNYFTMKILYLILLSNLIIACSDRHDVDEMSERPNSAKLLLDSLEQKRKDAEEKAIQEEERQKRIQYYKKKNP